MVVRDEFIFSIDGKKFYTLQDVLNRFDDILIADNKKFWDNCRDNISAYKNKQKRHAKEPEPQFVMSLPLADIKSKFGLL